MVAKYKEEDVLNTRLTWNEKSDDLDNILFKQNGFSVKRLSVESQINGAQSKIDANILATFGTTLLNDQQAHQNYYSLLLPSQACFCGSHAATTFRTLQLPCAAGSLSAAGRFRSGLGCTAGPCANDGG